MCHHNPSSRCDYISWGIMPSRCNINPALCLIWERQFITELDSRRVCACARVCVSVQQKQRDGFVCMSITRAAWQTPTQIHVCVGMDACYCKRAKQFLGNSWEAHRVRLLSEKRHKQWCFNAFLQPPLAACDCETPVLTGLRVFFASRLTKIQQTAFHLRQQIAHEACTPMENSDLH